MTRTIEYFFTLVSPWSYLGHEAFVTLAKAHGAEVIYKAVNLGPVFDETGGLPLAKRHPVRQRYRLTELQRWRDFRNLPLNLRPRHFPCPPGPGDKAVLAIAETGGDPADFMARTFRAYWAENRNIADQTELSTLLRDSGFEAEKILALAGSDEIDERYELNVREAILKDVFGGPSYVLDGEVFWGQDRLPLLEAALMSDRPPYRGEA